MIKYEDNLLDLIFQEGRNKNIRTYAIPIVDHYIGIDNEPDDQFDAIMNERISDILLNDAITYCALAPLDWKKIVVEDRVW